jgi:predicted signal transduction protein with EAL and GGDEF domain
LLDIIMPEMDGYQTFAAIRSLPNYKSTPVVMLTGLDDENSIEQAYESGATDFITKPINYLILIHRVNYILRANRYLVNIDKTTSLPNRDLFLSSLDTAVLYTKRTNTMLAIVFIDIDNFKRVNQNLGYRAGDYLLKTIAERLQASVRSSDVLAIEHRDGVDDQLSPMGNNPVARLGGNEFVVGLLNMSSVPTILNVLDRFLEVIRKPVFIGDERVHLTASIGVSVYPANHEDPQALLKQSESAMQFAKKRGGNQHKLYSHQIDECSGRGFSIETQLRVALEKGQLEVHYQPKVRTRTYEISGFEALVRWPHPELGMVPPIEFIPIAEQTGLILQLGEWVLERACLDMKLIQSTGLEDYKMSVNLSVAQFQDNHLVEKLAAIVEQSGLDPWYLDLEITEGLLMDDIDRNVRMLRSLKEMGIGLLIDDFGTGYSSLAYLKNFPITGLKVDQSFVRDVLVDRDDAAIVSTIIYLGDALRLNIIAEGVENSGHLKFLEEHGCPEVQGFYFSKALPVDKLKTWIDQWENQKSATHRKSIGA